MCNRNDEEKITLKFGRSLMLPTYLYDFVKEVFVLNGKFDDVSSWCEQKCKLIQRGQLNFSQSSMKIMKRVMRGDQLSQRAIGDLVRYYALNLLLDSLDF